MTINDKLRAAHEHFRARRFEQAQLMYRQVLEVEPHNEFALRSLAQLPGAVQIAPAHRSKENVGSVSYGGGSGTNVIPNDARLACETPYFM